MNGNANGSHIPNISDGVASGMKRKLGVTTPPADNHNSPAVIRRGNLTPKNTGISNS